MNNTRSAAQPAITFRDKITIIEHELTVATIIVASVIDMRPVSETDFTRLTTTLQRIRAIGAA